MANNKEDMEKWYVIIQIQIISVTQDQIVKEDFVIDKMKYVAHDYHWWEKLTFWHLCSFGCIN